MKLCVFCKNFVWEKPYDASTCPTCGPCFEGGCQCKKHQFSDEIPYDEDDFRRIILRAESCKLYMQA